MDQYDSENSAAHTLDRIRGGGQQVLMQVHERLTEIEDLLASGQFDRAHDVSEQVTGKLLMLAQAERGMGMFAETQVVKAADVVEGTKIVGWGTVETVSVEPCPHPGSFHADIVEIRLEGSEEPKQLAAHIELMVLPD